MIAIRSLREQGLSEIEMLLPWYASGALNAREAKSVEKAMARDSGLAAQYAAIEEECLAIIDLNESLGAPSARAMRRLFASIDAERTRQPLVSPELAALWDELSSRVVA